MDNKYIGLIIIGIIFIGLGYLYFSILCQSKRYIKKVKKLKKLKILSQKLRRKRGW
jgi:H+/Cl- antiporter ClcA